MQLQRMFQKGISRRRMSVGSIGGEADRSDSPVVHSGTVERGRFGPLFKRYCVLHSAPCALRFYSDKEMQYPKGEFALEGEFKLLRVHRFITLQSTTSRSSTKLCCPSEQEAMVWERKISELVAQQRRHSVPTIPVPPRGSLEKPDFIRNSRSWLEKNVGDNWGKVHVSSPTLYSAELGGDSSASELGGRSSPSLEKIMMRPALRGSKNSGALEMLAFDHIPPKAAASEASSAGDFSASDEDDAGSEASSPIGRRKFKFHLVATDRSSMQNSGSEQLPFKCTLWIRDEPSS